MSGEVLVEKRLLVVEGREVTEVEAKVIRVERIQRLKGKALVVMEKILDSAGECEKLDRTDKNAIVVMIKLLFPMGEGGGQEDGYEEYVHRIRKNIKAEETQVI